MRLLSPLGLAAGALLGPLVLWYVLRPRRPRQPVASTFLWRSLDVSVSASAPWQRFRPDATFWLVALALAAGVFALARPAVPVATALGDHTVLIVDGSASMLADEEGVTRLELARRRAGELVTDLAAGQSVSVVEAGPTARILLSHGATARAARAALARVQPSEGGAALADAFRLAHALERPGQRTRYHLFTDAEVPPDAEPAAPRNLAAHAVGSDRPNVAVARLEAVATGGGAARAFVQLRNFGLRPAAVALRVALDGGEVLRREVTLAPRGTEDLILPLPARAGRGLVEAWIEPVAAAGDGRVDALAVDDRARAVLRGAGRTTVLVATPGNVFLEEALASVEGVDVRVAAGVPPDLAGIDLLVVDRLTAPVALTVPTLLIAPASAPPGVRLGPPAELPAITFQSTEHPLLQDVDLSATAIAEARPLDSVELETLAAGPDGALLAAGRLGSAPVVVLGFDLLRSNLPLQVAWPVLVANTVSWLTAPPAVQPLVVGDELRFSVPPGVAAVAVRRPDGATVQVDASRPRVVVDRAGMWTASWVPAEGATGVEGLAAPPPVPVNVPPEEGDLARPRPSPEQAEPSVGPAGRAATAMRDVGRPFLVAALALLLAEWLWSLRPARPPRARRRPRRGTGAGRGTVAHGAETTR